MAYSVITISGNITRDPETIDLKDGRKGVRVGIAVNKSKDTVVFYNVLFTESYHIERITNYAKKGSMITLIGDHSKNKVDDNVYENIYGIAINELFTRDSGDKATTEPPTTHAGDVKAAPTTNHDTHGAENTDRFIPDMDDDLPF